MAAMCSTKGFLSFLILWLMHRKKTCICGEELAKELEKRRGVKPSPGTIYPALGELKRKKLIVGKREGRKVSYCLTKKGEREFAKAFTRFRKMFGDIFGS